jgi:hypothetical protein
MADNRRAGERTLFRGDVEGNDTLAEISRALELERRAPIAAVGAGFVPPAGGQASNIPAMADLEEELLREFALYEGPREPVRRAEPSFEPLSRAPAPVVEPVSDDDDTMPPMDAGAMFRAARPAAAVPSPAVREPVAEPRRVDPEPPAVFEREPLADLDAVAAPEDFAAQAFDVDEPVAFSGPVPDLAGGDAIEAPAGEGPAAEDVEPVFAGPVPDFDLEGEAEFDGPVPEIDLDAEPMFAGPVPEIDIEDEPAFSGPVPDLDAFDGDAGGQLIAGDGAGDLSGELELALGALDLVADTAAEPASPFAAWKNDRLSGGDAPIPAWLSNPATAPKWPEPAVDSDISPDEGEPATEGFRDGGVTPAVIVRGGHIEDDVSLVAVGHAGEQALGGAQHDLLDELEFDLDADDLARLDEPAVDEAPVAGQAEAGPASLRHEPEIEWPKPEEAVLRTQPVLPVIAPAAPVTSSVSAGRFDLPDWLQPAAKVQTPAEEKPAGEKQDSFDLSDFEFDFDEDAIEAEVSRAVMSELQSAPAALPADELPFDPSAITEIDDRMPTAFANVDVPQVPDQDGETVPKPVSDFDYDIEAEMAELFAMGNKAKSDDSAAEQGQPSDRDDDGLTNEIIRSIHETPAIPAGRAFDIAEINAASTSFVSRYARLAAVAAFVAFAGVGAILLWRTGDVPGLATDGTPRVIMADKSPIKEVPEQPGGKQVPNQDKAVYDRVAGNGPEVVKQDSLIAPSEEPVNVAAKTLENDGPAPGDAQMPGVSDAAAAAAGDADARLPASPSQPSADAQKANESVTPRKVKTMIVLPNGTLVARETPAPAEPAPSTAADAALSAPAASAAAEATKPAATIAAAGTAPEGQPSDTAQAAAATPPAVKPIAAPIPTARPADQPVNVVGTVTQKGNVVGQTTAPAADKVASAATQPSAKPAAAPVTSNTPEGAYVIQIASLPSQEEAQKSYSNLSAKFSSVIGGRSVDIKAAEIPGKGTFYRLRIVAGSKDDAIALCTRYKAAGGSCLVSR